MGFHDSGREHAKMKEELLEQGHLEPRLHLLAQEEAGPHHLLASGDDDDDLQHVVGRARDATGRACAPLTPYLHKARSLASRGLAPAAKALAPAAAIISPLMAPFAVIFRPAFLARSSSARPTKLRRTAYLDGIRGFAALMVYFMHHELWAHAFANGSQYLENAWGYQDNYVLAAFYGIRTFFGGGHFAVCTFFVLSGYVLSTKPLTLINQGDFVGLGDNVASALFRRWMRLYLPIILVTFFVAISPHVLGLQMTFKPEGSLKDEIWKWYCDCKNMFFIFDTGNRVLLEYHQHVWSIPVEFKGSILVYTTVMAVSRMTRTARLVTLCALWYYLMYIVDGAYFAMFTGGMIICDLELSAMDGNLPRWITALEPFKQIIFYSFFFFSMWWSGIPSHTHDIQVLRSTPGWYWLSFLKPQAVFDFRWFYYFWATVAFVSCVPHISWLKRFFETRACQHLGRISFMLYLLHGPILWTLGDRLYAATGWTNNLQVLTIPNWQDKFPLPKWGPYAMEISYLVPQLILLPLTLWLSEIGTTVVDDSTIKFVGYLYKFMLPEKPAPSSSSPSSSSGGGHNDQSQSEAKTSS